MQQENFTTRFITIIISVLSVVSSCTAPNHSTTSEKPATGKTVTVSSATKGILSATNAQRKQRGLGSLTQDERLMKAAQDYAVLMSKEDKLSHTVNGQKLETRVGRVSYPWKRLAENVAENPAMRGEEVVTQQWMKSSGHKANILGKEFIHIGIGVAGPSKSGRYYYCQVFGTTK